MQKPSRKRFKLEEIRLDYRLQSRVKIDDSTVSEYADAIRDGDRMPAVSVVFDKVYCYLVDGFHRHQATKSAGLGEIEADLTEGHFRDALLASVGANSKHGLRRTNDDKRRAVMTLFDDEEWGKWSDNQIAKACCLTKECYPTDCCRRPVVFTEEGLSGSERFFRQHFVIPDRTSN